MTTTTVHKERTVNLRSDFRTPLGLNGTHEVRVSIQFYAQDLTTLIETEKRTFTLELTSSMRPCDIEEMIARPFPENAAIHRMTVSADVIEIRGECVLFEDDDEQSQPKQRATTRLVKLNEIWLRGTVHEFADADLDIGALVKPLGLSGTFTIVGIDERDEDAPNHNYAIPKNTREARRHALLWYARFLLASQFEVTLTPDMTPFHIMQLAAQEHVRRHGDGGGGHIFFETMTIRDAVIEFAMGS